LTESVSISSDSSSNSFPRHSESHQPKTSKIPSSAVKSVKESSFQRLVIHLQADISRLSEVAPTNTAPLTKKALTSSALLPLSLLHPKARANQRPAKAKKLSYEKFQKPCPQRLTAHPQADTLFISKAALINTAPPTEKVPASINPRLLSFPHSQALTNQRPVTAKKFSCDRFQEPCPQGFLAHLQADTPITSKVALTNTAPLT
jgi:hypothetical protein